MSDTKPADAPPDTDMSSGEPTASSSSSKLAAAAPKLEPPKADAIKAYRSKIKEHEQMGENLKKGEQQPILSSQLESS